MRKKNIRAATIVKWWFLLTLLLIQVVPLTQLLFNSFRTDAEIKKFPIGLPTQLHWENYAETWVVGEYGQAFLNSFFIGFVDIAIVLCCSGLGAYALSKMEFRGKNFLTAYFLLAISIPGFLYIVPVFFIFTRLNLTNGHLGLILIYAAMEIPFNLLLIRTFLLGIPKELEEAAEVDGCTQFKAFVRIIVPLAKPIFMTVALLVFLRTWNEFLWANTFLQADELRTVATRFVKFTSEWSSDFSRIFTAGVISIAPIVVLYLFLQRYFVEGLTSGSVKG